jgi:hypothetical protein
MNIMPLYVFFNYQQGGRVAFFFGRNKMYDHEIL